MKTNKIYLSDIQKLIYLFTQEKVSPFIFDPYGRLVEDQIDEDVSDNDVKVFVNLAGKSNQFKEFTLSDFDFILDFGESKTQNGFDNQSFCYLNNPSGKMRWLYRQGNLKGVLAFYNDAGLRGKVISKGIQMLSILGLGKLIASEKITLHYKDELPIESLISPEESIDSIFMGTPGIQQTSLLSLRIKGQLTWMLKIPFSYESIRLINNEKKALVNLGEKVFHYMKLPKVGLLHYENALLIENLKTKNTKHVEEFTNTHALALEELHKTSQSSYTLKQCVFWHVIRSKLYQEKPTNKKLQLLHSLCIELFNQFDSNERVVLSNAHGDFTPWNLLYKENQLSVYDWELYSSEAPALYDFFHFHYQRGILMQKASQRDIVKQFTHALNYDPLKRILQNELLNVEQLHRLYLLRVVSYFIRVYDKQELTIQNEWQLTTWEESIRVEIAKFKAQSIGSRKTFLQELNDELKYLPHAFLKFDYDSLKALPITSDLDIAVEKIIIPVVVDFCENHPLVQRIRQNNKSFMTKVEIFFNDGEFLSLDLIHRFQRKSFNMLSTAEMLTQSRMGENGVRIPSLKHDLAYTFLFYTLNNAPIPLRYHKLFAKRSEEEQQEALQYLLDCYGVSYDKIASLFTKGKEVRALVAKKLRKTNWSLNLLGFFNYGLDICKGLIKPEGFMITFSGVDGVGKSTILKLVEEKLRKQYRKEVVLLRHRPGILPILSALKHGKAKAEQIASVTIPRKGKNQSGISSSLRFAYYFTDYLFGQLYVYFRYIARGKVVLYDRYYFDFINDARRSNIQVNKSIAKALYRLILKPRLNIFLYADPHVILSRKQELNEQDILELNDSYLTLFKELKSRSRNSRYTAIENLDLNTTIEQFLGEYKQLA